MDQPSLCEQYCLPCSTGWIYFCATVYVCFVVVSCAADWFLPVCLSVCLSVCYQTFSSRYYMYCYHTLLLILTKLGTHDLCANMQKLWNRFLKFWFLDNFFLNFEFVTTFAAMKCCMERTFTGDHSGWAFFCNCTDGCILCRPSQAIQELVVIILRFRFYYNASMYFATTVPNFCHKTFENWRSY